MKKNAIASLLLLIVFTAKAQNLTDWQVGVNASPFSFSRINTTTSYEKDKQDIPNGFGYGLTIEKNWNERWGIKTGFENTKQNIKYFEKSDANVNNVSADFEYYKVPISIQYYMPLKKKLFLTFNQGIQFSFLKDYKFTNVNGQFTTIQTSTYYQEIYENEPSQNTIQYFTQDNYNKNLFGIIGSVGLKGFLLDNLSYSSNIRYEYDIIDSDDETLFWKDNSTKPIHNFRIGLELGLQYHFKLDFYHFDKRAHESE